eukprot:9564442-Alexandrium_andersonii.AAC.1
MAGQAVTVALAVCSRGQLAMPLWLTPLGPFCRRLAPVVAGRLPAQLLWPIVTLIVGPGAWCHVVKSLLLAL